MKMAINKLLIMKINKGILLSFNCWISFFVIISLKNNRRRRLTITVKEYLIVYLVGEAKNFLFSLVPKLFYTSDWTRFQWWPYPLYSQLSIHSVPENNNDASTVCALCRTSRWIFSLDTGIISIKANI